MISPGEVLQILLFLAALTVLTPPLGKLIARIMSGSSATGLRLFDSMERGLYKLFGVTSESLPCVHGTSVPARAGRSEGAERLPRMTLAIANRRGAGVPARHAQQPEEASGPRPSCW